MDPGTFVLVCRGGLRAKPGTKGCLRNVLGIVVPDPVPISNKVLTSRNEVVVRLLEPDPLDTVGWSQEGDVGRWSRSAVVDITVDEINLLQALSQGSWSEPDNSPVTEQLLALGLVRIVHRVELSDRGRRLIKHLDGTIDHPA